MGFSQSKTITSAESWLPSRNVNTIFQDSEGILWVGTGSGLYKYDGNQVSHYSTNPNKKNAIFTNLVTDIIEDAAGNILIATESGLSLFEKKTETFTTLSPEVERFDYLSKAPDGDIWIHARNKLVRFSVGQQKNLYKNAFKYISSPAFFLKEMSRITALLPIGQNKILLGSDQGLFLFDALNQTISPTGFDKAVRVLVNDEVTNQIFTGTKGEGLFRLKLRQQKTQVLHNYSFGNTSKSGSNEITSIAVRDGKVLVSTHKMCYEASLANEKLTFRSFGNMSEFLNDNNVFTTYIDQTSLIWVGTLHGLLKVRITDLLVERIRVSVPGYDLQNQQVNYLFRENNERIWLKTRDDGSYIFTPRNNIFRRIKLPNDTHRFYKSALGYYLVLGNRDIYRFNEFNYQPNTEVVLTSSININCGIEIIPGEWWFGCSQKGLISLTTEREAIYGDILSKINDFFVKDSHINVMIKDANENIWVGAKGHGLIKANLKTGEVKPYSGVRAEGEISRRILHLKEDSSGNIWVCSREGGLYRYNSQKDNFTQYTTAHGLPSNVVSAIAEDENQNLIVSTDNGIAVYLPNQPLPFKSYDENDGIKYTDFSFNAVAESENGDVFFGNSNGIYKVNLTDGLLAKQAPFKFTGIRILSSSSNNVNEKFTENILAPINTKELLLNAHEDSFEIAFSLRDFSRTEKNRYAYRLKGYDEDWKYLLNGEQLVRFVNIESGTYQLEVKVADSFGRWNDKIHALSIEIKPPFWWSNTAKTVYALLATLLLAGTIILFRRWNNLQNKLRSEVESGIRHDQQMVYFSDLSHEIKNRLTLILGPLEKALVGKKVNPAVLKNLYEQTLRLKRITDQIVSIRKSETGEFLLQVSESNILRNIRQLCHDTEPLAIVRDIQLEQDIPHQETDAWFDEELLEIIVLNLLNNAIKYTPAGGKINVTAETTHLDISDLPEVAPSPGNYLHCIVEDTGIGIPENDIKYLFNRFYRASNVKKREAKSSSGIGLELVMRLIKKHRGFLDIKSEEGVFTRVEFYLPIEKKHFLLGELKLSGNMVPILEENGTVEHQKSSGNQATILIVDDEPEIRELIASVFTDEYNTITASTGDEALENIFTEDISLIISDLNMRGMNGLALLQQVKANPDFRSIPFIMLTGQGSESQKLTCLQNGVDDFINKPFSLNLLKWRAKNLIENRNILKQEFGKKISVEASIENLASQDERFIQQVIVLIEKHLQSNKLSVEFLAEECSMSRATFYRKMESLLGEPPSVFIKNYRLKKAALLLQSGNYYVSEIAYQTGFRNPKYFTKCFQKEFGLTPTEYIKSLTDTYHNQ
ncbi:MAG: signal transduction histidine kinase/ligand-binding sensor domain-containing protein [Spirosomataceae bacterium]